jgi:hypothetical protein
MSRAHHAPRAIRAYLSLVRPVICALVCSWLMLMQPGMSAYWLINPDVHARIDEAAYGQAPDGETLPGHEQHAPHDHPTGMGTTVPELTLLNPFDTAFYDTLLAPARRPAVRGQHLDADVIAHSITVAPPDQPPRLSA